jgi:hypothetical protein
MIHCIGDVIPMTVDLKEDLVGGKELFCLVLSVDTKHWEEPRG